MLLDSLFPKKCFGCGKKGSYICAVCVDTQPVLPQRCVICGKNSIDGLTHHSCGGRFRLDGVISIWKYCGVVRKALVNLKYKFAYQIASELAVYASNYLRNRFIPFQGVVILVPIPLYFKRENWRGFNQAGKLGKLLSRNMGWKYCEDLIIKTKDTHTQTELNRQGRTVNLRGAFEFNSKYKVFADRNVSIVLFDDVCTTGSTLREACKVVKKHGVDKVWGLTIAR